MAGGANRVLQGRGQLPKAQRRGFLDANMVPRQEGDIHRDRIVTRVAGRYRFEAVTSNVSGLLEPAVAKVRRFVRRVVMGPACVAAHQRGSRRCRGGPPPGRRKPPPPEPPVVLGRASFTLMARLPNIVPFNAAMARSAALTSLISTKANPRGCPVSRSRTRFTRSTSPNCSKRPRMDSSVAPKS